MHPGERVVRALFDAFHRADMDAARDLLADGCVFRFGGEELRGIDDLVRFVARRQERFDGSFSYELHDVLGGDRHAVALVELSAAVAGARVSWRQVAVYHIEDARIVEAWGIEEPEPS